MNSVPNKNDIISLEKKYWDAMKNSDVESAVQLTKFPCTLVSPKGVQKISEDKYREIMKAAKPGIYKGIELEDLQVEVLNNDTALITYSVQFNGMKMLDVSTWVRENDKWVCAYHAENPITQ